MSTIAVMIFFPVWYHLTFMLLEFYRLINIINNVLFSLWFVLNDFIFISFLDAVTCIVSIEHYLNQISIRFAYQCINHCHDRPFNLNDVGGITNRMFTGTFRRTFLQKHIVPAKYSFIEMNSRDNVKKQCFTLQNQNIPPCFRLGADGPSYGNVHFRRNANSLDLLIISLGNIITITIYVSVRDRWWWTLQSYRPESLL